MDFEKSFNFYVPLEKSETASDSDRLIRGLASCEAVDQQGEVVFQKGMDTHPLLESGWLVWDHQKGPDNIVGIPLKVEFSEISQHPIMCKSGLKGLGFYAEGRLFQGHPRADAIWSLLKALDGCPEKGMRNLAWSIEGATLERSNNQLIRTIVRNLAVTHQPVLGQSFAEIAKSLTAASAGPLMMEQIDAGQSRLRDLVYGNCDDNHFNKSGYFNEGVKGFLNHLMICKHRDLGTSKSIAASLIGNKNLFHKIYGV